MVIVYAKIYEHTGFFRRFVVFGVELRIGNCRSLEVYRKGEGERVVYVGINSAVTVVKVSLHGKGVFGVVFQVVIGHLEVDFDSRRINGKAAACRRFSLIINNLGENFLARSVIYDGYVNFCRTA